MTKDKKNKPSKELPLGFVDRQEKELLVRDFVISNIKQITDALGTKKIVMLDHDDLHSSIIKAKQPISKFLECFNVLVEYCKNNNVILLRTIGVVFSDEEKKVSDYIG